MRFVVEENGRKFKWLVPIMDKSGTQPHYLMERLTELAVQVGDELVLEMKRNGMNNFVEIRRLGDAMAEVPTSDDSMDEVEGEEEVAD